MRALLPLLLFAATGAAPAWAQSHAVTVRNGTSETIRAIQVGPEGRLGENRMRSQLPPGAEARITYSTGCPANVRLTFANGQTEDHSNLDLCTDPRITAGQSGVAGPAVAPPPVRTSNAAETPVSAAAPGKAAAAAAPQIAKTPVPPWTGRSLTRRFGGMD